MTGITMTTTSSGAIWTRGIDMLTERNFLRHCSIELRDYDTDWSWTRPRFPGCVTFRNKSVEVPEGYHKSFGAYLRFNKALGLARWGRYDAPGEPLETYRKEEKYEYVRDLINDLHELSHGAQFEYRDVIYTHRSFGVQSPEEIGRFDRANYILTEQLGLQKGETFDWYQEYKHEVGVFWLPLFGQEDAVKMRAIEPPEEFLDPQGADAYLAKMRAARDLYHLINRTLNPEG